MITKPERTPGPNTLTRDGLLADYNRLRNAHDELVAALREILAVIDPKSGNCFGGGVKFQETREKARAVLTKLERG